MHINEVYASTIGYETNVAAGCENDLRKECRVWIILPDGGDPIATKEDGINKMSIDKPEETE